MGWVAEAGGSVRFYSESTVWCDVFAMVLLLTLGWSDRTVADVFAAPYSPSSALVEKCGELEAEGFEPCVRELLLDKDSGLQSDALDSLVHLAPADLEEFLHTVMEAGPYMRRVAIEYWSRRLRSEASPAAREALLETVLAGDMEHTRFASAWAAEELCGYGVPRLERSIREKLEGSQELCEAKMALSATAVGAGDYLEALKALVSGEMSWRHSHDRGRFIAWCAGRVAELYVPSDSEAVEAFLAFLEGHENPSDPFLVALWLYQELYRRGLEPEELVALGFTEGPPSSFTWGRSRR